MPPKHAHEMMRNVVAKVATMYQARITDFTTVGESDLDGKWATVETDENGEVLPGVGVSPCDGTNMLPLGFRTRVLQGFRNSVRSQNDQGARHSG